MKYDEKITILVALSEKRKWLLSQWLAAHQYNPSGMQFWADKIELVNDAKLHVYDLPTVD